MLKTIFIRSLLFTVIALALSDAWAENGIDAPRQEQVVEPEIARRDVTIPRIDTENFEINAYVGVLSVEDLGAHLLYGARIAYHITEDFFAEASFGMSSVSDSSFRNFAITLFPDETEDLLLYDFSIGYNLLPGEVFFRDKYARSSAIFLIAGAGNTHFASEDFFTINAGIGIRVLPTDYLSVRLDFRDHMWSSDLLGENKLTHNLEFSGNLGFFF